MLRKPGARSLALDALEGALAGAIGTALMSPAMKLVPDLPRPELEPECKAGIREAKADEPSTEKLAVKVLAPLGVKVEGELKRELGSAVHWGYGIAWGALYGALSGRRRRTALASGVLFGFALWLLGDELLVPALGLSLGPNFYPPQAHAKGLAAHLAYGTATNGIYRALRAVV